MMRCLLVSSRCRCQTAWSTSQWSALLWWMQQEPFLVNWPRCWELALAPSSPSLESHCLLSHGKGRLLTRGAASFLWKAAPHTANRINARQLFSDSAPRKLKNRLHAAACQRLPSAVFSFYSCSASFRLQIKMNLSRIQASQSHNFSRRDLDCLSMYAIRQVLLFLRLKYSV